MPLISVIIPTCNGRARFVDQALASVAAQTFQDFELIIVDDTSTDGTLEYIQEMMPQIMTARPNTPIVYVQRETNGGPSAARNDGAKRANGELLAFLDQDDLWAPTFLEETSRLLQAMGQDTAALSVDGYCINANQDIVCYLKNRETNIQYKYHSITLPLSDGYKVPIQGSLLRKEAFETIKGFDENLRTWEDRDFVIRLTQHYRVASIPKPLYSFRRYGSGVGGGGGGSACANTKSEFAFASKTYFLEKHAPACRQDPYLQKALQYEWGMVYSDMGKYHLSQNQRKTARSLFRQSLRSFPFSRRTWLRYLRSYLPSFSHVGD